MSHLNFVYQIRLRKYRTTGSNWCRIFAAKCNLTEFFYFHTEAASLAGEERTGSGCTEGVHGVVYGNTVFHTDDFGILSTDFKDSADIRVQGGGSYCMCSNLIFYNAGVTHGTDKFAGTSGCSGSNDLIFILINFFSQGSNDFFGSAHRISLGPEIDSGEDIFFFIDNDTFGGNRSDVNS